MPETPKQRDGWVVLGVFHSVHNQYTVTAKRGDQVLRVERLFESAVVTFDAVARWSAR